MAEAQALFEEFKDMFAWSYQDLKGILPKTGVHHIDLIKGAKPLKERPYRMNPYYKEKVKAELDKMLEVGYIYEIEYSDWVSLIVLVPKKNGKIHVCIDYQQLNKVTKKDPFPIPLTEDVLETMDGKEVYSFTNGFSGHNQVRIVLEDQSKMTFVTEWGTYAYQVMPFGLTNVVARFQRIVLNIFKKLVGKIVAVFFDDWTLWNNEKTYREPQNNVTNISRE